MVFDLYRDSMMGEGPEEPVYCEGCKALLCEGDTDLIPEKKMCECDECDNSQNPRYDANVCFCVLCCLEEKYDHMCKGVKAWFDRSRTLVKKIMQEAIKEESP